MEFMQELGAWIILTAGVAGLCCPFLSRGSRVHGLGLIIGGMFIGAGLLAFVHGRRFKANAIDYLVTWLLFGAIVILPVLPILFWIELAAPEVGQILHLYLAFLISAVLGLLLLRMDRATGRYFPGGRELRELEGSARVVADTTLARLGHPALSIRVAPLGSFNACVQGVRHCIVIVDRRAAESLSHPHFASLLAHEVGHLKLGGLYSYLLVISLWMTVLTGIGPFAGSPVWSMFVLLGCSMCSQNFLSQVAEVFCDRFASKHSGTETTGGMLKKTHDDTPNFALAGPLQSLALSHPPLGVRLAALGCAPRGVLIPYASLWFVVLLVCLALPLSVIVACASGVTAFSPALHAVSATSILYLFLIGGVAVLRSLRLRRTYGVEKLQPRRRGSWIRWLSGVSTIMLLGMVLASRVFEFGDLARAVVLVVFVVFLGSASLGILTGAFRSASEQISGPILKTMVNAAGAFDEGRTEESLAIIDRGLSRYPTSRHLAMTRGAMLLHLGRLDEAASALEALRAGEEDYGMADVNIATLELLRGNLDRAGMLVEQVIVKAPELDGMLHLAGLIAYERGLLDYADEKFLGASRVKANDVVSLCGRALVALERGDGTLARSLVEDALAVEKPDALTLIVSAIELQFRGDGEEARIRLNQATQRARERGRPGWIPYYERLAARKGLSLERPEP
jgi:Zn-dependent protease with chaperone function